MVEKCQGFGERKMKIEENKQNYETVESGDTLIEKEENLLNESSRRIRNRNRNY